MFGPIPIIALRPIEREGRLIEPGTELRVPFEEAKSMFALGFAAPLGSELAPVRRPVRGRFVPRGPR